MSDNQKVSTLVVDDKTYELNDNRMKTYVSKSGASAIIFNPKVNPATANFSNPYSIVAGVGNGAALNTTSTTWTYPRIILGQYAKTEANYQMLAIGAGTGPNNRTDILRLTSAGKLYLKDVTLGGITKDYAEYFEWADGNLSNEDRIGLAVSLLDNKIVLAQTGDTIFGIISGTSSVIGNSAALDWHNKYVTDDFGRVQYEDIEVFAEEVDPNTGVKQQVSLGIQSHPILNPDYDPEQEYIPREERPEWACVGLLGQIYARDDGTCLENGYAAPGINGVLTYSAEPTNIYVMKRTKENIVQVFFK